MGTMSKTISFLSILVLSIATISFANEQTMEFGRFGTVHVYRASAIPAHVVLFVSGDGGWNLGVVDMARELTTLDSVVAGIDIRHYLRELEISGDKCSYPASDFEALSKFVQKSLHFPKYTEPILIGYSSGATLVYATLVQAPPNTFAGAVSLGFCPDLPLTKSFCKGNGLEWKAMPAGKGDSFLPAKTLKVPWIAMQGETDQVCHPSNTDAFAKQVIGGEVVMLPKVGHGFAVPRNWMPQFRAVFSKLSQKHEARKAEAKQSIHEEMQDLPLIELPAANSVVDYFAIVVSGDGGWANIDRQIGDSLLENGIPVVGFDSLQYFWTVRTPAEAAKDLQRILTHYLTAWKKDRVVLIGYSLGADVLPFMTDRLSPKLLSRIKLIALLGPGKYAEFEFHMKDWLEASDESVWPTRPEVEKLRGIKLLCFYGLEEEDSLCKDLNADDFKIVPMTGGHHLGGDYQQIARRIMKEAGMAINTTGPSNDRSPKFSWRQ